MNVVVGFSGTYNLGKGRKESEVSSVNDEDKIRKALLKKALGYNVSEVAIEYDCDDDGELKVKRKKVTKKHYSPDVAAVKVLLERYFQTYGDKVHNMSDEELADEELRLLQQIKEGKDGAAKNSASRKV